ncbi:MAG: hypothetical protein WC959_09590 [Kiritimatiellales bacterium]
MINAPKINISTREGVLLLATFTILLTGIMYWVGGPKIAVQRRLGAEKERLQRQIEFHQRLLVEQENWTERLTELQAQMPVYDERVSVTAELLKEIKRIADEHRLDLVRTQPYREEQIGTLFDLGISCNWEGTLESLVKFLFALQSQGIRYDVRQLNAQPDAQREGILRGSMIIDCAYRRGKN